MPYLQLAPRQPWEPWGQACSLQAVHWLSGGLADYNPGRPTHLTCGQTVMRIIILRPGSWRKGQLPPLFGQKGSLEATTQAAIIGEWQLCRSLSWRFFHRRSPGRERTRMADIDFSSYRLNVFLFPVHPIAQEKADSFTLQKFFSFF